MAIAFVQSITGSANSTSIPTSAFSSPTATGNLIVVAISGGSSVNGVTSVTDTAGNTYAKIFSAANSSLAILDMWYAANITGVGSNVVTVTRSSAVLTVLAACEYSGIAAVPLDVWVTGTASGVTAAASGSTATTTVANELVVGGVGTGAAGTTTATAGSGYGNLVQKSGASLFVAQESKAVSSTGTQSAAFTLGSADYSVCGCTTFKGAPDPIGDINCISKQAVNRGYFY